MAKETDPHPPVFHPADSETPKMPLSDDPVDPRSVSICSILDIYAIYILLRIIGSITDYCTPFFCFFRVEGGYIYHHADISISPTGASPSRGLWGPLVLVKRVIKQGYKATLQPCNPSE